MTTDLVEIQSILALKRQGLINHMIHLVSTDAGDYRAAKARIETLDTLADFIEKEVIARRKIKPPLEDFTV